MAQKRNLSPQQDIAANPSENIWVQANAGTGKTSVLVQRLLRILFRTESLGANGILCLTYTNAGAGEMRNRILAALRTWAMATDAELADLLHGVSNNKTINADDIAHAREIFYLYIDNPDILKIKTIHGFCEEILHRFPLEAGISPSWSLVSDASQRVLLQDAFHKLINSSLRDVKNGAAVTDAFSHIVGRVSETYLNDLLEILSSQYKYFFQVENLDNYRKYFVDTTKNFLDIKKPVQTTVSTEHLKNILQNVQDDINSSKTPKQFLQKLVNLTQQYIDKTIDFEEYKKAYLNADGTKTKNVSKKEYLISEQDRVYDVNQQNINKLIYTDTIALFDLAAAFADTYREMKSSRNLLDFEDLILYTRKLFSNPETMGWVLSQLNISLSHILVDEAQDTSPLQWDILRMLSGDFFTDGDTEKTQRSLFVVGDTKQSIYGFQGADPRAFATSRDEIARQIENNYRTIREVPLAQSFRSVAPILQTVDAFFGDTDVVNQTGFANNTHACFRTDDGLVELHKLISKQTDETDVLDYVKIIADKIKSLVASGAYSSQDIMVLVQNRHPMASPLVTELKRRGIDVAGSDRIILPDFPAIRDLLNLVRFCINNTDDFSLCCTLKSPIYRLKERDIFNICKTRNDENKSRKQTNPDAQLITVFEVLEHTHPEIFTDLTRICEMAKTLSPYSFFTNVLNNNGVRESMIAALGNQILDPLEEFITICLAYERTQSGTMRHFLKWFVTGGSEIKRDMDASSGVRIVTIHGSKGLEAPVVFLIDTVRTPKTEQVLPLTSELVATRPEFPDAWLWLPRANDSAQRKIATDELMRVRIAEYYRLLYVAMTRARDRLYIYGYTANKSAPELAWHTHLWRVLSALPYAETDSETVRITNAR